MSSLSSILETSAFLSLCENLRQPGESVFPGRKLRSLRGGEIRVLERQGNFADNWAHVRVIEDFSALRIYGNFFLGPCVLGRFAEEVHRVGKAEIPSGIFESTLSNVLVGDEVLIHRCALVSRYIIDAGAALTDSRLSGEESSSFGNGISINAGIETGGRRVPLFYDLDPRTAERAARGAAGGLDSREAEEFLTAYAKAAALPSGYVGKKSGIHGTNSVENSFIGPWVRVDGAARIRGSTLYGAEDAEISIGTGCIIDGTVIRPGCRFDSQAITFRSFFADGSGAERQAKITESYIGPNSKIAGGEVTASFAGPFVGLHHQSLLIAAFWPAGRGNIGHGANIGSNHSSRMPDGEVWPGEGMFFGLGCNIKYPADYSRSPYLIIATGVTAQPQKVEYPFSLITQKEFCPPGVPSGYNRLIPAWVLGDNFYALERSREKFVRRNRTPRIALETDPLSPENMALAEEALRRLSSPAERKDFYLPGDIPGTGKNILLEEDRRRAVDIYAWFIRFVYLRRLFSAPAETAEAENQIPHEKPDRALAAEYRACLDKLYLMVLCSRQKDENRGKKIIPDYGETHVPAAEDEIVAGMRASTQAEKDRLDEKGF
jgi:NDP-sugar pyrophosphorylase family protein